MTELSIIVGSCRQNSAMIPGFYVGQILRGHVELRLSETQTINSLDVLIYGTGSNIYGGKETYKIKNFFFMAEDERYRPTIVESGLHQYNFEVTIPETCPESIEIDSKNYVSYRIKAALNIQGRPDIIEFFDFKVARNHDLNDFPDLKTPCNVEQTHQYGFFSCTQGKFAVTVSIPYSGFVSGSIIPVKIHIDNMYSSLNDNIETKVIRQMIFSNYKRNNPNVPDPVLCRKKVMTHAVSPAIGNLRMKTISGSIKLPAHLLPTNEKFCKIIKISYYLQVKIGRCKVKIPITIGKISLNFNENEENTPVAPSVAPAQELTINPSENRTETETVTDVGFESFVMRFQPSAQYDEPDDSRSNRNRQELDSDLPPSFEEAVGHSQYNTSYFQPVPTFEEAEKLSKMKDLKIKS